MGGTEHARGHWLWAPCQVRFSNYSCLHPLSWEFSFTGRPHRDQCHNRRQFLAGGEDRWPPLRDWPEDGPRPAGSGGSAVGPGHRPWAPAPSRRAGCRRSWPACFSQKYSQNTQSVFLLSCLAKLCVPKLPDRPGEREEIALWS